MQHSPPKPANVWGARLLLTNILIALTFSLILITPVAAADPPQAPATLIIDVLDFRANASDGNWAATLNVSFMRSVNDPGTWNYTLNASPDLSICPADYCYNQATYSTVAFTGDTNRAGQRVGWGWLTTLATFGGNEDVCSAPATCLHTPSAFWGRRNFTLWANDTGTNPGTPSCTLNIDLQKFDLAMYVGPPGGSPGDDGSFSSLSHKIPNEGGIRPYYACGSNTTLAPPAGVQALVEDSYKDNGATNNITGTSTTNISWHKSPDDANFTLDYYVLHRYNDPPAASSLLVMTLDNPNDGLDTSYLHSREVTGDGTSGAMDPMWVSVLVRDNLTHQQSNDSCLVGVIQGVKDSASGCGDLTAPLVVGTEISPVPVFPFLNVNSWSARIGLSPFSGSLVLGCVFMLTIAVIGFYVAYIPGLIGGGVVGFVGGIIFGLFPSWVLFAIFTIAVTIIVLLMRGNSGGEA